MNIIRIYESYPMNEVILAAKVVAGSGITLQERVNKALAILQAVDLTDLPETVRPEYRALMANTPSHQGNKTPVMPISDELYEKIAGDIVLLPVKMVMHLLKQDKEVP